MDALGNVLCEDPAVMTKARELADFLQVPLNSPQASNFQLQVTAQGLKLSDSQKRILQIDFIGDHLNYRRQALRGKNELLAKALGWTKGSRKVLDLSAGLAVDAVCMTQLGFQVTAIERSSWLFVLLREALAQASALQGALRFVHAEAQEYVRNEAHLQNIDVIFFDPMYPHKKKTALPKQEMVVFRELVGDDQDAAAVLHQALLSPVGRVAVKRPIGAEELLPGVHHAVNGKVVRYDIYMR